MEMYHLVGESEDDEDDEWTPSTKVKDAIHSSDAVQSPGKDAVYSSDPEGDEVELPPVAANNSVAHVHNGLYM